MGTGINLPGPRALGGRSRLTTSDSTEEGPTGTGAIPGTGVRTKWVSTGTGAIPGTGVRTKGVLEWLIKERTKLRPMLLLSKKRDTNLKMSA